MSEALEDAPAQIAPPPYYAHKSRPPSAHRCLASWLPLPQARSHVNEFNVGVEGDPVGGGGLACDQDSDMLTLVLRAIGATAEVGRTGFPRILGQITNSAVVSGAKSSSTSKRLLSSPCSWPYRMSVSTVVRLGSIP